MIVSTSELNTKENFEELFPELRTAILEHAMLYSCADHELQWLKQNLQTNVLGGKYYRGMFVPTVVSILVDAPLSEKQFLESARLGWLVEFFQASFLVSDDLMDGSISRRGQPCWYRRENVGVIAINDSAMIQSGIFILLKKYFQGHPSYMEMMHLFQEAFFRTGMGQLCDMVRPQFGGEHCDNFSRSRHLRIVKLKTSFYTFYLPVALALMYQGLATSKNLTQSEILSDRIGEYFQVQDDFLDLYGIPGDTGKKGTDIVESKCTWFIMKALERSTKSQSRIILESYGRPDHDAVAKVKQNFSSLDLPKLYRDFEREGAEEIRAMFENIDQGDGLKRDIFSMLLNTVYGRVK